MNKKIIVILFTVLLLVLSIIPTFAIPPSDPDIFYPNEPFYMNIEGRYFGLAETLTDSSFSNNGVTFWRKDSTGLTGVEYDYSTYSNREVNNDNSYFLYFDYVMQSNNVGGGAYPRMYVWCANGTIMIDEVGVGNNSSAVGFCLALDVTTKQLKVYAMSGGNIQYNTLSTYDVSNWITYDSTLDGSQTVDVYSFRIEVEKSTGLIRLQAITTEWFNTIKTIRCGVGPSVQPSYNRLAFGVFDRIDGYINDLDEIYGSVSFRHIRYQDYNATYEIAFTQGIDNGFYDGYDRGLEDGYDEGKDYGYNLGKQEGIEIGKEIGASLGGDDLSVPAIFNGVFGALGTLWNNIFGYEILGINISGLVGGVIVIGVAITIYALVRKFKL